jgi:hypothetical protein
MIIYIKVQLLHITQCYCKIRSNNVTTNVFKCDFFHTCGRVLHTAYVNYNAEVHIRLYRRNIKEILK